MKPCGLLHPIPVFASRKIYTVLQFPSPYTRNSLNLNRVGERLSLTSYAKKTLERFKNKKKIKKSLEKKFSSNTQKWVVEKFEFVNPWRDVTLELPILRIRYAMRIRIANFTRKILFLEFKIKTLIIKVIKGNQLFFY